ARATRGSLLFAMLVVGGLFLAACGQTAADVPQAAKDTFEAYVNLELQGYETAKDKAGHYLTGPALNLAPLFAFSKGTLEGPIQYTVLRADASMLIMAANMRYSTADEYHGHKVYDTLSEVAMVEVAPDTWKIFDVRHIISGSPQLEEKGSDHR
ncbi:MAG: hypothetical protein KM310_10865, partial [Clostridiales bacterium]|nr:hypothetical protein [Clostridiales bacterium]